MKVYICLSIHDLQVLPKLQDVDDYLVKKPIIMPGIN